MVAIAGILVGLMIHTNDHEDEKKQFMADCQKHEAEYQCEYKWKQMHPDPVTVYAPFNK